MCHVYSASGRWDADVGGREGWEYYDKQAPRSTCTFEENIFYLAHDVQRAGSLVMSRPTIIATLQGKSTKFVSDPEAEIKLPKPNNLTQVFRAQVRRTRTFTSADLLRSSAKSTASFRVHESLGERSARLGLRKGTHSSSSIAARYGGR